MNKNLAEDRDTLMKQATDNTDKIVTHATSEGDNTRAAIASSLAQQRVFERKAAKERKHHADRMEKRMDSIEEYIRSVKKPPRPTSPTFPKRKRHEESTEKHVKKISGGAKKKAKTEL